MQCRPNDVVVLSFSDKFHSQTIGCMVLLSRGWTPVFFSFFLFLFFLETNVAAVVVGRSEKQNSNPSPLSLPTPHMMGEGTIIIEHVLQSTRRKRSHSSHP